MRQRSGFHLSIVLHLAAVAALASGCASAPDAAGAANSLTKFSLETAKANDTLDGAVMALKKLVESPGDLKGAFESYTQSVKAVEQHATVVKERADEMKAKGDEYFKNWEAGTATGLSPERHQQLTVAYGKIKEQMLGAKDAFTPFLSSLKDIQSYLSLDLSAKGLEGVAPLVAKAQTAAADVKSRISGVIEQANAVSGMLSTKPAS